MKILGFEIRWSTAPGCRYNPPYDASTGVPRGPHCDPLVLHGPGDCTLCGAETDAIAYRIHEGINFTGQSQYGRSQCPAEQIRPLEVIHCWVGNRPVKEEP